MPFRRIDDPPVSGDPALGRFLQQVADEINGLPPTSRFSATSPNSTVTAVPGTLGVNAASSVSVAWVKQTGSGNTGWVPIA